MLNNTNVSLEHKSSHNQHGDICSNSQQYIVWVKIIIFYLMPKIIRILRSCSMKIFCTVNISKFNFFISNMHCWELNLNIFKDDFLNILIFFLHPFKYYPIITNHASMQILSIQLSDDVCISIWKYWPLRLVLFSRVTNILNVFNPILLTNVFAADLRWSYSSILISNNYSKH